MKTIFIALALIATPAHAGTYNFYFNNTEQGANSKAAPSVVVKDGQLVSPAPGSEPTAVGEAPPLPTSEPAAAGTSVSSLPEPMETTFPDAKWKFSLGAIRANYESKASPSQHVNLHYERSSSKLSGSLTFYPIREAGFSFHVGRFLGPELEVNPFGVKTGWGKMQFGLLLALFKDTEGYEAEDKSTWAEYVAATSNSQGMNASGESSGYWKYPMKHTNPINVFTGAQVGLNIVRDLSLNLAYRIAPIQQNDLLTSSLHWSLNYLF